ncbi:MAG: DUF4383 domain-containing protein [Gammaproteobacteria bacterium]
MNARNISLIYGMVFVLVGILGFFSNPVVSDIGFFQTNAVHNLVHIGLGGVFIAGALTLPAKAALVLKFLGLGGIAVAVLGFLTRGSLLVGIIHVNEADHWLHLGLALVVLGSGFIFPDRTMAWRQSLPGQ